MENNELFNPTNKITPTEFELFVFNSLKQMGKKLNKFEAVHNSDIETHDGNYQIDIKATFEAFNCNFTVLIECKCHTSPIKREIVQILHTKLQSSGAHKGIIFSTSQFQSGVKDYAWQHGIALIQLKEGSFQGVISDVNERYGNNLPLDETPNFIGEFYYEKDVQYISGKKWPSTELEKLLFVKIEYPKQ